MTYTVRIIFDGVVAIGPAPPCDLSTLPGPLFAIMPRANRHMSRAARLSGAKPTADGDLSYIPVHFPVVFTDLTPIQEAKEEYRYHRPPDDLYKTYNIWYPVRERLIFRFDNNVEWGDLTYQGSQSPPNGKKLCVDSQYDVGDVCGVADMRQIWPDRYRLRPEMASWRAPAPQEVNAQVFVPGGNVSSGGKARYEEDGQRVEFKPTRTRPPFSKCLVPQTIVTAEVKNSVDILSYSLDTGEKLDWISFDITKTADIWVGNADPGDIRLLLKNLVTGDDDKRQFKADFDFELYYQLLEGEDDGAGLPVPRATRFGEPNCYTTFVGGT